ncbi:MAG TPA: exonuclease sbcCD subunit D [Planctomycetes bacterium]|nr:exonuclease sbcCD subunit D [Planctomycetota bacterium]
MRILHTSDWHLGHTFHGLDRGREHAAFLAWLLELIVEREVDALLVTGDVFDSACPPVSAERAWLDFLAEARVASPGLDVVVIGGNHDSAQRLDAPGALLRALGVHVVGGLARREDRSLDLERLLVPLHDAAGEVAAWVAAVPFLRPADLPRGTRGASASARLEEGVRAVYDEVLAAARERRQPGQALLGTGHCTLRGSRLSAGSERTIYGGDALPVDLFPAELAYVAMGHLHHAQAVAGRDEVRYAGSPLPLSFAEAGYEHEVRLVQLAGEELVAQEGIAIPRAVDLIRLPAEGPAPLAEVLELIAALPECKADEALEERPYLEVRVQVEGPAPGLRRHVEEALDHKRPRLVKLEVRRSAKAESLPERHAGTHLGDLDPRDVFQRCYARQHEDEQAPAELLSAFEELLSEVRGEQDATRESGVAAARAATLDVEALTVSEAEAS